MYIAKVHTAEKKHKKHSIQKQLPVPGQTTPSVRDCTVPKVTMTPYNGWEPIEMKAGITVPPAAL